MPTLEDLQAEFARTAKTFQDEVKGIRDGGSATTAKIEKLQDALDKQAKFIDELILAKSRPAIPTGQASTKEEKAARAALIGRALRHGFDSKGHNLEGKGFTPEEVKALGITSDPDGGYLVPVDYATDIIKSAIEFSPMRDYARIYTTSRTAIKIPVRTSRPGVSKHSEGKASGENANDQYGMIEARTKEYKSIQIASNEVLEDNAYNLESQLSEDVGVEMGVAEGTDFMTGNGQNAPEGVLTTKKQSGDPYFENVQTEGNDAFASNDVINLFYSLKEAYAMRGVFMGHRAVIREIRKFKSTTGEFLWQPGLNGDASQTLMGKPIREAVDMASTVADGAKLLTFGDFRRAYGIVDRLGVSMLRDPYTKADEGLVRFVFRKRTGGVCLDSDAAKILVVK